MLTRTLTTCLRSYIRSAYSTAQISSCCRSRCLQRKPQTSSLVLLTPRTLQLQLVKNVSTKIEVTEVDEPDALYRGIDIYIMGHEDAVLESYSTFATIAANELGIKVAGVLKPRYITDRITLLKSIHIYKKHRVQYEAETHKRVIQLQHLTGSTADVYLSYLQINIPAGVAMQVHKWAVEALPRHLEEAMDSKREHVTAEDEAVAEKFKARMADSKLSKSTDYEEYQTTKPYLVGTTI